jgi:error-prone DNA polymerase
VRKRECHLAWEDVAAWSEGLLAVLFGDEAGERLTANLQRLKTTFGNRGYMALIRRFAPDQHLRLCVVEQAAQAARVLTAAPQIAAESS